jgi:hypothetical protein
MIAAIIVVTILCVASRSPAQGTFSYDPYASILETFVNDNNMVDYATLNRNPAALNEFVAAIGSLEEARFEQWDENRQIAFLINAYNALALKVIIDHYPIEASFFRRFFYPDNSIQQIPGVFDRIEFPVMGRKLTLDNIEHDILRKRYNEPRIHVALVCAAKSCPPLRREPYRGGRLESQLEDQSRRFMNSPQGLRVDRERNTVYLSSIFKWFGEDFIQTHTPESGYGDHGQKERAVLNYAARYRDESVAEYLRGGEYRVQYLDYDWSLNEQG